MHACIRLPEHVGSHLDEALRFELDFPGQISWLEPAYWRIYLVGFGNVTRGDPLRLAERVRERAGQIAAPTLRLSAVEPLPYPGDDAAWVGVDGEEQRVRDLAAEMPRWVHDLGFVPDRRAYRPGVQLGRMTGETQLEYLEGMQQRLSSYAGPEWTVDAIALGRVRAAGNERRAVFELVDLAPFRDTG